jgi:hypothetical protein
MNQVIGVPHACDTPRRPEAEQRGFFEAAMELAYAADRRGRTGEFCLSVAGIGIRLLFASEALQSAFMPALAHLQTDPISNPAAVFHVWDSASTGIAMLPAPCPRHCFTDRGDIWGFDHQRFRSAFHWSDYSLNLMDMQTGVGMYWVRDADSLPYWVKASPLRTLLHWLMARHGRQILHAAAVGTEDGGVLICGKGGVGKSTTALACLEAGMAYVADDYLVVQLEPEPRAFPLYGTAKLEPAQIKHFPRLQTLLADPIVPDGEKAVVMLSRSDGIAIASSLKLVAALTPEFAAQAETTLSPAPPAKLQHAAAFTTMSQLPHAGRTTHEFIARLIARLECHTLLLGQEIDQIPAAIAAYLAARTPTPSQPTASEPAKRDDRPLISVIIPVYNGAHFLRDCVASILAQSYANLEIIVVDDGSTDDLRGAVRDLSVDVRFFSQHNSGPAAARNLGIRNAVGELFAFLDVDDLWPEDMLGLLVARLMERPDLDVVHGYGQLMRLDTDGAHEFIGSARESFPYFLSAALYRRRAFEAVGLFDADLRFSEDTDWFTRAREKSLAIERLEQVTLRIRRHDGNMTRGKNLRELGALRFFKKALDRRRQLQGTGDPG